MANLSISSHREQPLSLAKLWLEALPMATNVGQGDGTDDTMTHGPLL